MTDLDIVIMRHGRKSHLSDRHGKIMSFMVHSTMVLYLSMPNVTRVDGQPVAAYKSLVMPGDKYWRIVFLGSK